MRYRHYTLLEEPKDDDYRGLLRALSRLSQYTLLVTRSNTN